MREMLGSASRGNAPPRSSPAEEPGCPPALRSRVPHGTASHPSVPHRIPDPLLDRLGQPRLPDHHRRVVVPVRISPQCPPTGVRTDQDVRPSLPPPEPAWLVYRGGTATTGTGCTRPECSTQCRNRA